MTPLGASVSMITFECVASVNQREEGEEEGGGTWNWVFFFFNSKENMFGCPRYSVTFQAGEPGQTSDMEAVQGQRSYF